MQATTDPSARSWIAVSPDCDFPIQNLPYGVFRPADGRARVGIAIGLEILDLSALDHAGLLPASARGAFSHGALNTFLALGRSVWRETRARVHELLREDVPTLRDNASLRAQALFEAADCEMLLPAEIGDYTDFYSSRDHAFNVGTMFRGPENALMPNWLHLPVAYHGRSSSIVVSGTAVHRPCGQTKADEAPAPSFGPSRLVDFELETGFLVGSASVLGHAVPIARAAEHIFGMVLVNDWSARDIQKWEYQPLGPFLSKNFATSISPWVVTMDALEPFRCEIAEQDPEVLPYLRQAGPRGYDIDLEVWLVAPSETAAVCLTRSNTKNLYWSFEQQLAHHTVTGCNLRPGDLLASGTISGPNPESRGCLLERTWRGTEPIQLPSGATRRFLEDGDEVIMRGAARKEGVRIGFGEVRGRIRPAELRTF